MTITLVSNQDTVSTLNYPNCRPAWGESCCTLGGGKRKRKKIVRTAAGHVNFERMCEVCRLVSNPSMREQSAIPNDSWAQSCVHQLMRSSTRLAASIPVFSYVIDNLRLLVASAKFISCFLEYYILVLFPKYILALIYLCVAKIPIKFVNIHRVYTFFIKDSF